MGQKPTSVPLAKWVQPLVKPPVLSPYCTRRGVDKYVVTMSAIQHRLHPDLNLTQASLLYQSTTAIMFRSTFASDRSAYHVQLTKRCTAMLARIPAARSRPSWIGLWP
jgi:hypothetical protein